MRKIILLFLIVNLGTSNFYFASYPPSIKQLLKYSNQLNHSLYKKIRINKEPRIPLNYLYVGSTNLLHKSFEVANNSFNKCGQLFQKFIDSISETEIKYELGKMKANFGSIQKEKKTPLQYESTDKLDSFTKMTFYKIFAVTCLGFILVIIKLTAKLEYRKKKAEQLKFMLENRNKDLTNFTLDIARKNEFTQELGVKLKQIKKTTDAASREVLLQELIIKTHNHLKTNKDFEQFQQNIKKVNHAFFEKIRRKYNKLTSNEIHLCGLIRLGLTIKDIASIKNISPKSVEMNRYPPKKKTSTSRRERSLPIPYKNIDLSTS